MMRPFVLISCEHGGNGIPPAYYAAFKGSGALLRSHRGYDPGALEMARALATMLKAPLVASTTSRLLIDLNRSLGHRQVYSDASRGLQRTEREQIVAIHYRPYRDEVERRVRRAAANGRRVLHISSHSFTPELHGEIRSADIGLLYDPGRPDEKSLSIAWKAALENRAPALKVRRNYPYEGKNDGLTRFLRSCCPMDVYAGIELEINQKHVSARGTAWAKLQDAVAGSLRDVLSGAAEAVAASGAGPRNPARRTHSSGPHAPTRK